MWLIGVANKNIRFVPFMGITKHFAETECHFFADSDISDVSQMPRFPKVAISVPTMTMTTRTDMIALSSVAHVCVQGN